ncbi:MAG: dienelactone hydrolase family protein [Sphingomonadaceae bacterium]|nr:dienelactone hydrolase family protein [Sphingomonadaceae bacterium]
MHESADPAPGAPQLYRAGDVECRGELYRPVGVANGRAVLVVHEADGIGGNVRRHSRRLAAIGYTVLAADMHGGGRVLEGDEMRDALDRFRSDPDHLRSRVCAALEALARLGPFGPDRLAAIGYCFGGFAVLELARDGAPVAAVASFHGLLTTRRPAGPATISARVAAFTGARDPLVPPEDVASFQAEMMRADADWQMAIYGQALHSFTNPDVDQLGDPRMRYDARAHAQSWDALLGFLDDALA